jgi:hypothetical protein
MRPPRALPSGRLSADHPPSYPVAGSNRSDCTARPRWVGALARQHRLPSSRDTCNFRCRIWLVRKLPLLPFMVLMLIAGSCSDPPRAGTGSTKGNGVPTTSKFAKSLDTFRAAIAADLGVSGALLQVSPSSDKVIALTEAAPPGSIPAIDSSRLLPIAARSQLLPAAVLPRFPEPRVVR